MLSATTLVLTMTKSAVLEIFARANRFISPDQLCTALQQCWDRRCVYSYLLRLKRQGLLETGPNARRGRLAYRLTERGHARLRCFRSRGQ
jgi:Fe2+ or Zn2+ uptake regulation protein